VPRFGVGHVDHVVLVDVHAAWSAKLKPLGNECAVLVKDLDSVVLAVADEQPAAGIESQGMDHIELARAHSLLSPCQEEFTVLVELHDPRIAGARAAAGVSVADEDVAGGPDRDIGWRIELIQSRSSDSFLAECEQDLSVLSELEDLVPTIVGEPQI